MSLGMVFFVESIFSSQSKIMREMLGVMICFSCPAGALMSLDGHWTLDIGHWTTHVTKLLLLVLLSGFPQVELNQPEEWGCWIHEWGRRSGGRSERERSDRDESESDCRTPEADDSITPYLPRPTYLPCPTAIIIIIIIFLSSSSSSLLWFSSSTVMVSCANIKVPNTWIARAVTSQQSSGHKCKAPNGFKPKDLNKYEIVNIFVIQCQRAIGDEGYIEACIQAAGVD